MKEVRKKSVKEKVSRKLFIEVHLSRNGWVNFGPG
jgi:hypothetical protein